MAKEDIMIWMLLAFISCISIYDIHIYMGIYFPTYILRNSFGKISNTLWTLLASINISTYFTDKKQ